MVLITLTGLSIVWIMFVAHAWPTAVYDTNFQAFDRSLTPPERAGVIGSTKSLMLLATLPPALLCVAWALTTIVLLIREPPASDGQCAS